MPGRPIRLVTTAAVVSVLAAALSASAAFAGCGTCGYAPTYYVAPPPPPVVYVSPCGSCAQNYVAPRVVYAPPCGAVYSPCGATYAPPQPAYRVDLGQTYTQPIAMPEETEVEYAAPRSYRYVSREDYLYDRSYYYTRRPAAYQERDYRVYPRQRAVETRDYRYRALRARLYGAHIHRDARFSIYQRRVPMTYRPVGPRMVHAPITRMHHEMHHGRPPMHVRPRLHP